MRATRSRKLKVGLLAELTVGLESAPLDTVVAWLSGDLVQGRIGVGYATAYRVSKATPPTEASTWSVDEVNAAFSDIAEISGAGSKLRREQAVGALLAQTAEDGAEAIGKLGQAVVDVKLDGARIQVHKRGDEVRVYTRRLREVTAAVPEVVEVVGGLPAHTAVLDGEVIALRPDGRPHPFQTTMRRFGRKTADLCDELPLTPFFFDCLYVDGVSLIDAPLLERLQVLDRIAGPHAVPRRVLDDAQGVDAYLAEAMALGHEGVMAKACDAPYAAGARGRAWLKLKPAHTLDLVVLAADWGSGRRTGWLSNLHLGARDEETGDFVMLGKTFKGMTDALLEWQTEALQAIETHRTDWTVHVRPELVVEIAFNEVQTSPKYAGGLALRFARVKGYRPDKSAQEADTVETVRRIHAG